MKTPQQLTLHFGAVAPPIKSQLKKQGYKFNEETVKHFQKDADAFSRLYIRKFISLEQANKMRDRLHTNIIKHIRTF